MSGGDLIVKAEAARKFPIYDFSRHGQVFAMCKSV